MGKRRQRPAAGITSTIARGLSLYVAIVVAGLTFAFGEGGSKRILAGVLFGIEHGDRRGQFSLSWALFPARTNPRLAKKDALCQIFRRMNIVHRSLSARPAHDFGAEKETVLLRHVSDRHLQSARELARQILIFLLSLPCGPLGHKDDPQILRFLLTAAKLRRRYDPGPKFSPVSVRKVSLSVPG